jgi:hypothetical protein
VSSTLGTPERAPNEFEKLKEWIKNRMPDQTKTLVRSALAGQTFPPAYGDGDPEDRIATLWASIAMPYVTPAQGVMSDKGVEILAAILASVPDGRALHDAYAHDLRTWRESEAGQEIIVAFDAANDYDPLQVRDLVAGRFEDESQDPFVALKNLVNGDLIALAEDLNDFSESDEELEPAAIRKIPGSSDAGVDPTVDAADEEPKTSGGTMSSEAAAAELDEMAKSDPAALEAANDSAAKAVASLNLKKTREFGDHPLGHCRRARRCRGELGWS